MSLEDGEPLPFELYDVLDEVLVGLLGPCIMGWDRIVGYMHCPWYAPLGFPLPLDHDATLTLPLEMPLANISGLPLSDLPLPFPLPFPLLLPLGLPLSLKRLGA